MAVKYGTAQADKLLGTEEPDVFASGAGSDTLEAGAGPDVLMLGDGQDRIYLHPMGVDTILDFSVANDQFMLDAVLFTAFKNNGPLPASAFVAGIEGAFGKNISYVRETGTINYSGDGTVFLPIASVEPGLNITAASFQIVGGMDPVPDVQTIIVGDGPDRIDISFTQDAYQGDTRFSVSVDGRSYGEFEAETLRGSGKYDTLTIRGEWPAGNHQIAYAVTNDLYGGAPDKDRNLHIESMSFNGKSVGGYLYANGPTPKTHSFTKPGVAPLPPVPVPAPPVSTYVLVPLPPPQEMRRVTGPVRSQRDGEKISGLIIETGTGDSLTITHKGVILENLIVKVARGKGINVRAAPDVRANGIELVNTEPPAGNGGFGAYRGHPDIDQRVNCYIWGSPNGRWYNVVCRDGSTGFYILDSANTHIQGINGFNFHGDFPRGQLVQFGKSHGSRVSTFFCLNDDEYSRPEDNMSCYQSNDVVFENGLIVGNSSFSGVGIMFEATSVRGRVRDVDCVGMRNGSFSSYADDIQYERCRDFDRYSNRVFDGRPVASTNGNANKGGLIYGCASGRAGFRQCGHDGSSRIFPIQNIAWDSARMDPEEIVNFGDSQKPKAPILVKLHWDE